MAARVRGIPELLWPEWSLRLLPARGLNGDLFRAATAACLLLPGQFSRHLRPTSAPLHPYLPKSAITVALYATAVCYPSALILAIGLIFGGPWSAYACGRLLLRYATGPAGLLGARRLLADPLSGTRTYPVLVLALLGGAFAAGTRSRTIGPDNVFSVSDRIPGSIESAERYARELTFSLITACVVGIVLFAVASMLITLVAQIVTQRRSVAAVVAAGAPRSALGRALLIQLAAPFVPTALLTAIPVPVPAVTLLAPTDDQVPWLDVITLPVGAVLAVLVVTAASLIFLRSSTSVDELQTE
jgi:hypothetical protein